MTPEERTIRKREQNRVSARIRRAAERGECQPPPPGAPRLTANPARASVVRDYATGRTFNRKSEVFKKCLKLSTF